MSEDIQKSMSGEKRKTNDEIMRCEQMCRDKYLENTAAMQACVEGCRYE